MTALGEVLEGQREAAGRGVLEAEVLDEAAVEVDADLGGAQVAERVAPARGVILRVQGLLDGSAQVFALGSGDLELGRVTRERVAVDAPAVADLLGRELAGLDQVSHLTRRLAELRGGLLEGQVHAAQNRAVYGHVSSSATGATRVGRCHGQRHDAGSRRDNRGLDRDNRGLALTNR